MEKDDAIKLYSAGSTNDSIQWFVVLFAVINVIALVGAILSNLVALIALLKQRTLHSPSNTLLGAMCLGDIVSSLFVHTIYEHLLRCLRGGTTTCVTNDIVTSFHANFAACKGIVCFITATVSLDRYLAICYPFKYLAKVTIVKYVWITLLFSGSWVTYSVCLILILPLKMFYCSIIFIIFCSMATMNFCYTRILLIVHKQRIRVQTVGEIGGTVTSPQMREKSKAFVIFAEIFIFNIFNLPLFIFAIYYLIRGFHGSYTNPFVLMNLGFTLSNITSFLNPFVYCFRSSEVRKAARKLVPKNKSTSAVNARARKITNVAPVSM